MCPESFFSLHCSRSDGQGKPFCSCSVVGNKALVLDALGPLGTLGNGVFGGEGGIGKSSTCTRGCPLVFVVVQSHSAFFCARASSAHAFGRESRICIDLETF